MSDHPTGRMSVLRSVPPMPPTDLPPAPPAQPILQHHPAAHPGPVRPTSIHITIDRPFRTAWAVGLGLVVAGWTVTLTAAALGAVVVALAFAVAAGAGA